MLKEERHSIILDLLFRNKKVLTADLSESLEVSEDTIRRDLKELSDNGHLLKVHGGALIQSSNPFSYHDRKVYAQESKQLIAQKALPLLVDGMVILIDGGTTNLELVRQLPNELKATFFTNSLPVAVQLSNHSNIEVVFAGGKLLKDAQVTIGKEVMETFSTVKADLAFLGTRGVDAIEGISEIDWEEAKVKRSMVASARNVVSMAIVEKLNTSHPYPIADINQLSTLITDLNPNDDILIPYRQLGIRII